MEKKIAEARAVREESDSALSLSSDAKEPNGMSSLARKATMSGTAAERVKVGDIFTGTWTQTRDPASVWEVDLSVLEITGDAVKVRVDFPRQKLDTNGRVNNVGLVHLSEGSLANGEMKLECKNVNLPQFQDNVGWTFVVVVRNGQLIGSNFDLKLVPAGR